MSAEAIVQITNEEQYLSAIERIEFLWDSQEGTAEHQALEQLLDLVYQYEGGCGVEDELLS